LPNSGFLDGAVAGGMSSGNGQSAGWSAAFGDPVVFTDLGCEDDAFIRLAGNCLVADGLATSVSLDAETQYSLSFCYRLNGSNFHPGSRLIARLSEGPQSELGCTGNCMVVGEYLLTGDADNWQGLTAYFTSSSQMLGTLTLHVENPLDLPGEASVVDLDNICIEAFGFVDATEQRQNEMAIRLFPNPTTGELTLEFTSATPKAGVVQILDLYGRQLISQALLPNEKAHSLSIAALSAGMYFVRVMEDGVPGWTRKVVKQ